MNYYFDGIFSLSPLIKAYTNRDVLFKHQAKKIRMEYEKHTGVNYYSLTNNYEFKHQNKFKDSIYTEKPNTWNVKEIAATVTQGHLDIIRYARESDMSSVLIFENDVLFKNNTKQIFDKVITHLPTDWDILYLGGIYNYDDSEFIYEDKFNGEDIGLVKFKNPVICAHSYALSKKAIKIFEDEYYKQVNEGNFYIIDQFLGHLTYHRELKTYGILPKLFEQGDMQTPYLSGKPELKIQELDISNVRVREKYFHDNKYYSYINEQMYLELIQDINPDFHKNKVERLMEDIKNKIATTNDIYEKRMNICKGCKFYNAPTCQRCGCDMVKKNKIKSTTCPINKF